MNNDSMEQALLEATLAEMKRALDDPNTSTADHALENSGSLGNRPDSSIEVDLDMAPGGGPRPPAEHGTWTDEHGKTHLTATFSLRTSTTVQMTFTNHAKASLAVRNRDGEWETRKLTQEQQETLDRYASEAAFWLTGSANGALAYTDEDPGDYEDQDDRNWIINDLDQYYIRRELGEQALICIGLARRTGQEGRPDAAYLDAAMAIRLAAAKVARANQYPGLGEARKHHQAREEERNSKDGSKKPANQIHLELDRAIDPELVRKALEDAGITALACQPANPEHSGYILTEEMAKTAWEQESGYSHCRGQCSHETDRHRPWDELEEDQKHAFLEHYAEFIEEARTDDLILSELLDKRREFDDVLTSWHAFD